MKMNKLFPLLVSCLLVLSALTSCAQLANPSEPSDSSDSFSSNSSSSDNDEEFYAEVPAGNEEQIYALYRRNPDGTQTKLTDMWFSQDFWVIGEKIYYVGYKDCLYHINFDGTGNEEVFPSGFWTTDSCYLFRDSQFLYFDMIISEGGGLKSKGVPARVAYDENSGNYSVLTQEDISSFDKENLHLKQSGDTMEPFGTYLYYSDGSTEIPVAPLDTRAIYRVADDCLYYVDPDGNLNSTNLGGFQRLTIPIGKNQFPSEHQDSLDEPGAKILSFDDVINNWLLFTVQDNQEETFSYAVRTNLESMDDHNRISYTLITDEFRENYLK